MKSVCIVILNYNNYEDTIECINSVKDIEYKNYEIVVIDNCSSNDSVAELKKKFNDTIVLIENDKNLGYAGGNNVGLKYAYDYGFEYVCILNNDTVVKKDFLSKCVEYLEVNKEVAFVGPIVLEYTNDIVQSSGGRVLVKKGSMEQINTGKKRDEIECEIDCDYISGACMVFKTKLLQSQGYIPENYFLFYEETEWCYRVKKNGYRNVCINSTYIRHKGSISINQVDGLNAYLMARNRIVFYRRNIASGWKYVLFLVYLFMETIYRTIRYDFNYIRCLGYYYDGITNKISKRYPFILIRDDYETKK